MYSQEDLSFIDTIQAKLQARVGIFLSLKDRLLDFLQSSNLTVRDKAKILYTNQTALEEELFEVRKILDQMSSGAYSFSDIITVADFYYRMEKQISDVQALEIEYEKTAPTLKSEMPNWLLLGLIGAGVILLVRH